MLNVDKDQILSARDVTRNDHVTMASQNGYDFP